MLVDYIVSGEFHHHAIVPGFPCARTKNSVLQGDGKLGGEGRPGNEATIVLRWYPGVLTGQKASFYENFKCAANQSVH